MSKLSLLELAQEVSQRIFLPSPSAVLSATDKQTIQLYAMINKCGRHLRKRHDWEGLKIIQTFLGSAMTDEGDTRYIAFPTYYDRSVKNEQLWDAQIDVPCWGPLSAEAWSAVQLRTSNSARPYWSKYKNRINLYPEPADTDTFRYTYITRQWVKNTSGGGALIAEFGSDADGFLFDDELMILGVIYMWKQAKGLSYAEEMEDFERLLEMEISRDLGSGRHVDTAPVYDNIIDASDWWPGEIDTS